MAAVLLVAVVVSWLRGPQAPDESVISFSQALPFNVGLWQLDVSSDGSQVILADDAEARVYLRRLDGTHLRELNVSGVFPRFSPDGRSIVVADAGELRVASVSGGPARTVGITAPTSLPAAWGDDGDIYFTLPGGGLGRMRQDGGAVDTLIANDSTAGFHVVQEVLPGGRGLIFSRFATARGEVLVLDLERRTERVLFSSGGGPRLVAYSATGHLLYTSERFLLAQPFDLGRLELSGEGVPVAEVPAGELHFAFGGGTLVYTEGVSSANLRPVIVDRTGRRRELPNLPEGSFNFPEVSPDGARIAMNVTGETFVAGDIWVYEMPEGPLSRLSLSGDAGTMSWTSDGDHLVFIKDGDAYRMRSDGSEEPELLLDRERELSRAFVAQDGQRLFFQEGPGAWDVGVATVIHHRK